MEPILSVKDLSVSFKTISGTVQAVRDVTFDLNKGETLAIVGESGSGKSVTTKAILGVLAKNGRIDGGSIPGRSLQNTLRRIFIRFVGERSLWFFRIRCPH